MAQAKGLQRWLAIAMASITWQVALAQEADTDPQVARDNAEAARLTAQTALLTARTANIKARYGEPANTPEGSISGTDKFGALAQWSHAETIDLLGSSAMSSISSQLNSGACLGKHIYITSVADARGGYVVAKAIEEQLKKLTKALRGEDATASPESIAGTAAAIKGVVGTLDSLIGLFRSDYSIGDISTPADELALRMKIAALIAVQKGGWERIHIDGLSRAPAGELPLMVTYREFDKARNEAVIRKNKEKDEKRKAELAMIISGADAFDTAITTQPSTGGGQSPLVAAAIALENPPASSCVLFSTYNISTSTITRKRLLSRNDRITTASGGLLKLALFDQNGGLLTTALVPMKNIYLLDLKSLKTIPTTP